MTKAMTLEQAMARIAELESKAKKPSTSIKVSAKGAVSVYGMGRFPVTLYASQWEALFGKQEDIKQFIIDNVASLAVKTDTPAQATEVADA